MSKRDYKVIMFDVDGVLAEFTEGFTRLANAKFGDVVPITKTVDQKNWSKFEGMSKGMVMAVWEEIAQLPTFWYNLEPLVEPKVFYRIDHIRADNHVYFVTARHQGKHLELQTRLWLEAQGIMRPQLVFAQDKAAFARSVEADYSIEDNAENAIHISQTGTKSHLLDRPYNSLTVDQVVGNRGWKIYNVQSVEQYLDAIERDHAESNDNERVAVNDAGTGVNHGSVNPLAEASGMQRRGG